MLVEVPGSSRVPATPWVGSRSPDAWDQIPYRPGGWVLHQPPWSFGFDSQTRGTRENRRTLCKSTGFLTGPSPAMGGLQIPRWLGSDPLSAWWLGLAPSHPGVLGSIPKREEPGKTGAPCVKVPGSSRVPVVECASLPPASSSLTHTRRMDGFCNQNADQLGSLAGLSFPVVYVGVVECATASPYTYSSTHRFPDEHTPIETTPLSATSAELRLGLGLGLGLGSHSSSHAPLLLATLLSHNIPLPRVH